MGMASIYLLLFQSTFPLFNQCIYTKKMKSLQLEGKNNPHIHFLPTNPIHFHPVIHFEYLIFVASAMDKEDQ